MEFVNKLYVSMWNNKIETMKIMCKMINTALTDPKKLNDIVVDIEKKSEEKRVSMLSQLKGSGFSVGRTN